MDYTQEEFEKRQAQIKENRRVQAAREQAELTKIMIDLKKENVFKKAAKAIGNFANIIFNPSVPMNKRARFVDMSHWNTLINWPLLNAQVDGYILKIGGMDMGNGAGAKKVYEDVEWANRVQNAYIQAPRKPIEGYFFADPDYHLLQQRGADWVRNRDYKVDEVIIQIINSLHNGAWTWDNLRPDRGWKPVEAFWVDMEETDAWNGKITPVWQEVTLSAILNPLHSLQLSEKLPSDMKLGMYTRPLLLRDDFKNADGTNPVETYMWNRRDWIYLWLAQWIWPLDPDIQLTGLDELWAKYLPPDTFKFLYTPYQLENRVFHHQFTGEKFDIPAYRPEVDANLHMDTVAAYYALTKFTGEVIPEPPPIPPVPIPADLAALTKKVDELTASVGALSVRVDALSEKVYADSAQITQVQTKLNAGLSVTVSGTMVGKAS